MTYPEDYGQPPQYPQQGYGRHSRQDEPWQPQQYDPFAHQQRIEQQPQGPVGEQYPWEPQPWEQRNRQQQPYGQPWPPQDRQDAPPPPPWQPQPATPPQTPRGRKRKSWPARHKVLTGLITFGALVVIIAAASASNKPSTPASDTGAAGSTASPSAAVSSAAASSAPASSAPASSAPASSAPASSAPASSAPASSAPAMSLADEQAVQSAQGYLSDGQGFSEQGLLNQLTSSAGEGFAPSAAEFAINYLNPNWDQQAVDAATGYLGDGQGFSEQGLIQQLTSSDGAGFTVAQAEFAINNLNPNWDQQAVDAAKGYLSDGQGFSQSELYQQLTSSYGAGFTSAQADYALSQVGM